MGDSPGKRLVLFRNSQRLSQEELAIGMGISRGAIAQIESDVRTPSKNFLIAISNAYGVNADWLLNGHGEMLRPYGQGFKGRTATVEPPDYAKPCHGDVRIDGYDCVRIRRMDLSVSAGRGVVAVDGPDAAPLVVPVGWMQRLRVNADVTVMVRVQGDSMAPTVPDGSYVLIHLLDKTVDQPGIYAFTRDGEAFIKRLIPSDINGDGHPGTIMVMSDNPAYPPYALTGPHMNDLRIVGRIRMVLFGL